MASATALELREFIRTIPDFPLPGILYRDITPLLASPKAFRCAVQRLAEPFRDEAIGAVAAAEARGFLFGAPLAMELETALVPIRKKGKLPFETLSHTYDLEYGCDTLEIHVDAIAPGTRVLVLDDVLATGGTVEACCRLAEKAGGIVVGCAFLVELLALEGRKRIEQYPVVSLIQYD